MSAPELPTRPRLATHAIARRHITGGRDRVIIHDGRQGGFVEMAGTEWDMVSWADGTRDFDGIVLASARQGSYTGEATLRELLTVLLREGLLVDGIDEVAPRPGPATPETPLSRPVSVFRDYRFHCTASGICCSVYPTISFVRLEALRARVLKPDVLEGGFHPNRVFLPDSGSVTSSIYAVTMVDGHCAYLGDDGLCSLHAIGGVEAKPRGCHLYPLTLVDDGLAVRASMRMECPCALTSGGGTQGDPLVAPSVTTLADMMPVHVTALPEQVVLTSSSSAARESIGAWAELVSRWPAIGDVPETLWSLADALERDGPSIEATSAALESATPVDASALAPWIDGIAARACHMRDGDATWMGEKDRARRVTRWLAEAATDLRDDPSTLARARAARGRAGAEELYLRATIHGHHLGIGARLVWVDNLRDRAVRVLIARRVAELMERDEASAVEREQPITIVELLMRARGLAAYVSDVAETLRRSPSPV